jgi:hypothetical protein
MEPPPRKSLKRAGVGGVLALIGFMLSPLSWWNDLVVNVPLALAGAWVVSLFWPRAFGTAFVLSYWLTNVLGFVLLQKGASMAVSRIPKPYDRRRLLKDLVISALYTLLILALVKFRILAPLPDYLRSKR